MNKTVLSVDDSATMRAMLQDTLTAAGFRVLLAEDGIDGLDVLKRETPNIIITDINMPRLDGFGFIESVRRLSARRSIPIIVLSTEFDDAKKQHARNAGATGWIVKPFDPPKLVAAVNRLTA